MTSEQPDVNTDTGEALDVTPVQPQAVVQWRPSALAEMSGADFDERLRLAQVERQRLAQIQKAVMTDGVDFGVIPGTDKPSLYKPGAEVLNKMAGLKPSYEVVPQNGDGQSAPHIHYRVTCRLHRGSTDGPIEVEGVGSCNSWEKKYRYRSSGPACPDCGKELRKSKHDEEWYCWVKKDGCGAKYPLDQFQGGGTTENEDPYELDNTLLKMAKKRAYVDATLTDHAASGLFTQDVVGDGGTTPPPADGDPSGDGGFTPRRPSRQDAQGGGRAISKKQGNLLWAKCCEKAEEILKVGDPTPEMNEAELETAGTIQQWMAEHELKDQRALTEFVRTGCKASLGYKGGDPILTTGMDAMIEAIERFPIPGQEPPASEEL